MSINDSSFKFQQPHIIQSGDEMFQLGVEFAKAVLASQVGEKFMRVGIKGDYNSGKSSFVKGVASVIAPEWEKPNLAHASKSEMPNGCLFVHFDREGSSRLERSGFGGDKKIGHNDFSGNKFRFDGKEYLKGLVLIEHASPSSLRDMDYFVEIFGDFTGYPYKPKFYSPDFLTAKGPVPRHVTVFDISTPEKRKELDTEFRARPWNYRGNIYG